MSHRVVFCNSESVCKECLAVLPEADLTRSQSGEDKEKHHPNGGQGMNSVSPLGHCPKATPCQKDEDADEGQVGVTISHGLTTYLHQAYHGDQHADVPEPSDR